VLGKGSRGQQTWGLGSSSIKEGAETLQLWLKYICSGSWLGLLPCKKITGDIPDKKSRSMFHLANSPEGHQTSTEVHSMRVF
jgi:hypothetical protein